MTSSLAPRFSEVTTLIRYEIEPSQRLQVKPLKRLRALKTLISTSLKRGANEKLTDVEFNVTRRRLLQTPSLM
jgi:hypothetical protein